MEKEKKRLVNVIDVEGNYRKKIGSPTFEITPQDKDWAWTGGPTMFYVINESPEAGTTVAKVTCVWEPFGGGGPGPRPPDIPGSAVGSAELKIAHIDWDITPMVQVSDGESEIVWDIKLFNDNLELVSGLDIGPDFSMNAVNVSPAASWTLNPTYGDVPELDGIVTSADPSRGNLRVDYDYFGGEQNSVSDPIAFFKVDITDPTDNDIHLKGEEVKFDGKVEPAGLSGLTYAWSVLEGTCDPATATTEDFQTTLKSEGTINVKLVVTVGGTTCETNRTIKAVLPEITKLSWKDDHDLLQGATGSSPITDPVWTKTLGGAVTKNEPGAYTKDGYATAELEIEGDSPLTHSTSVQVKGDGNTENFAVQGATFHNWTWTSGELRLDSSPLYASVNFYDTLDVTWYYRVEKLAGGWGSWVEMNQSQHVLYITLTKPTLPEATPHIVIISNACHWAANQQTPDSVCQGMLDNGFKPHYVWQWSCAYLSSDFIRLIASVGIEGEQHYWSSLWDAPHVGAMVEQRTISFTPVGGSEGIQEWNWHQWAEAVSKQRDASSGSSLPGAWGDYEDYFFTQYQVCTNLTPYQTTWVTNQAGQSVGCEVYPTHCLYSAGTNLTWSGPPGPQFW